MPESDLHLDGSEISVIKAIGMGGGDVTGDQLQEKVAELELAELIDTLKGLIALGYVLCDRNTIHNREELEKARFHVNSGYVRDLKEAINPQQQKPKSRRVRRE